MHREIKKFVVTLLVMRSFLILLGASRACVDFREPTEVSRILGKVMTSNSVFPNLPDIFVTSLRFQ